MQDRTLCGKRVLIVGINFAPEETGIAPYTTQFAEYLHASGADVRVITGLPHYPRWSVPPTYSGRFRSDERVGDVTVRRLKHSVPNVQNARTRALYEATFGTHVLLQRLPFRPHVIVAVVPSLLAAVAAAAHARRVGCPLVLWVQDLMGPAASQSGLQGGARLARLTSYAERAVMRRAATVVVVSEAFRAYVSAAGVEGDRVVLVPNWTHVSHARIPRSIIRRALGWADEDFVALHSGNMGLKQALEHLVAAGRSTPPGLRIVLMGDGSQRSAIEQRARDVSGIQLLPPSDASDFPSVLAAADVLLVNERTTAIDMSLPSKLTSYFNAGVPVLGAVPASGATAAEIRRSGGGIVVPPEDPCAIVAALVGLRDDPELRLRLGLAGRRHAERNLSQMSSLRSLAEAVLSTTCLA